MTAFILVQFSLVVYFKDSSLTTEIKCAQQILGTGLSRLQEQR